MNRLLAALTTAEPDALPQAPRIERFDVGSVLHDAGQTLRYAYFPIDAVVSHGAAQDGGAAVETGTVGREGVVSAAALFGDHIPFECAVIQVSGSIALLPIATTDALLSGSHAFRQLVGRYLQAYAAQVAQSVVCNASHPSEARLARWLLMCLDRTDDRAALKVHNGLLAEMLGVGRPTATVVMATLRTAGLIELRDGTVTVADREALEEASCDCYRRVRSTFERLLPESYPAP